MGTKVTDANEEECVEKCSDSSVLKYSFFEFPEN